MSHSTLLRRFFVPRLGFLENRTTPAALIEPVTLYSTNGLLDVTLIARQSTVYFDTAQGPVDNALTYSYVVNQGGSNGPTQGEGLYPGPTLKVDPGDTLVFRLVNEMEGMTIPDFTDLLGNVISWVPVNNHTHGLHVSPAGNSDNVVLSIPAGESNTYTYQIDTDQPQGLYWYHPHRHMVTKEHVYRGLAGMLQIGRADGNIPLVTQNNLPIRNIAIQNNYVFDRKGGLTTLISDKGESAPFNFTKSDSNTWFIGGPGTMPNNLLSFYGMMTDGTGTQVTLPADPTLPDNQRDLQFTINGQFQPTITSSPGQTEIWSIVNMSDAAYTRLQLTHTADGSHPTILVLGQDGITYTTVATAPLDNGTALMMPPATRFLIAVTMPQTGDLLLEMGQDPSILQPYQIVLDSFTSNPASSQAWRNLPSGVENAKGVITIQPSAISHIDGTKVFPTQILLRATVGLQPGTTVDFLPGQLLGAYNDFGDLSTATVDFSRTAKFQEGFLDPNNPTVFVFEINGEMFPYPAVFQPTLNSVEEWTYQNLTDEEHPIHIHVNDHQVMRITNPNTLSASSGVQMWDQDVINLPPGKFDAAGNLLAPGEVVIRMRFTEFTGTYVYHCHRLKHEDTGLMQIVTILPEKQTYAVGLAGVAGKSSTVQVRDAADESIVASLIPFPGFNGPVSVAMGDVNNDAILDLIVGAGFGGGPRVSVYSGADQFQTRLQNFFAFPADFLGGVSIAAGDINGDGAADVIVGAGPGMEPVVSVFSGPDAMLYSRFNAYTPRFLGGISVAAGMIDESGRISIVTGPGAGGGPHIATWQFDLYQPSKEELARTTMPMNISNFWAFSPNYTGGVSLATGWTSGEQGGFQNILVGSLKGASHVVVFSSGSSLQGFPSLEMEMPLKFTQAASFYAFGATASGGVHLAASSTRVGASLYATTESAAGSEVAKFKLNRPNTMATFLQAELIDAYFMAQSNGQAPAQAPSIGGA